MLLLEDNVLLKATGERGSVQEILEQPDGTVKYTIKVGRKKVLAVEHSLIPERGLKYRTPSGFNVPTFIVLSSLLPSQHLY
jgi:hypothetical protein